VSLVPLLPRPSAGAALRVGLLGLAMTRIARGARRGPPLRSHETVVAPGQATVVVPARDEARRIGPCIRSLVGQGAAVIVVDDGSTDDTRAVAESAGAEVIDAGSLPAGWAGKAWALQVGLEAASTPVVVAVDADCRAEPGFVAAATGALDGHVLVTAGTCVDASDAGGRAVHAAMLSSLLYRLGPPGVAPTRPARTMANGQCMVFDRAAVLAAAGFRPVAGHLIEDLALARHLASRGHPVAFVDGTSLLTVTGYGSAADTMRGWGRSLALAEVTSVPWLVADLAVVWSAMALPLPRLLCRRGDAVDVVALVLRLVVVAVTAGAFRQRGVAVLLAPLVDVPVAVALTVGAVHPSRRWRGRDYS
jgi:dolichol-phosphate mannosyltransferase